LKLIKVSRNIKTGSILALLFALLFALLLVKALFSSSISIFNNILKAFNYENFTLQTLISAIGGLAMLFSSGAAFSASTASALIDWSTFTITVIALDSGLPNYELSDEYSHVYSFSSSDNVNDWRSPILATSANGSASADQTSIQASSNNGGFAGATREGTFSISNGHGINQGIVGANSFALCG
jgi:hypothetical protein